MLFCNNAVIPQARFSGAAVLRHYANQYFLTGQELSCVLRYLGLMNHGQLLCVFL